MSQNLPAFYFQPTICWVDDEQLFLDAAALRFSDYQHQSFTNPVEAIEFFKTYQAPLNLFNFRREFTESDVYGTDGHFPVDMDIAKIREIANCQNRHDEIAVIVVDYNMPHMNGLEFCRNIQHPAKKILLTGEANNDEVIKAFNEGLIDHFVRKDHNTAEQLAKYIKESTTQYFYEKSASIIAHIEASRQSPLSNQHFVSFTHNWQIQNEVTEYYLFDIKGSIIAKNAAGSWKILLLSSPKDAAEFIEIYEEILTEHPNLLTLIKNYEAIPFFGINIEPWQIDTNEWGRYFFPSIKIENTTYFHTVIDIANL